MKKLWTILLWLSVLGAIVVYAFKLQPLYGFCESAALYGQGYIAIQNQNYREALKFLKPVTTSQTPFTQEALAHMGYAYNKLEMPQQALDYYLLCAEQDPKNYTAQLSIARLMWQMGWLEDSREVYERLLNTYPGNQPLMVEVAESLYRYSDDEPQTLKRAIHLYEEGLGEQPQSPLAPWIHYAELTFKQRQYTKALGVYAQIVAQEKSPPEAIQAMAVTLSRLHRPQMAAQWMQIAAEELSAINPELAQSWQQQALTYKAQAQSEQPDKPISVVGDMDAEFAQASLNDLMKQPRFSDAFPSSPSGDVKTNTDNLEPGTDSSNMTEQNHSSTESSQTSQAE